MNRKAILAALRKALGGAKVIAGEAETRVGSALHNVARPNDYRGPIPAWDGMAKAGDDMISRGVDRSSRGRAMMEEPQAAANPISVVDNEFDRPIPPLRRHEGSWMVTSPSGEVRELYTEANVKKAIAAGWKVETAGTYLGRINQDIRGAQ